jgi:hypothetical protein
MIYHAGGDPPPPEASSPAKLRSYWIEAACPEVAAKDAQRYAEDGGCQLSVAWGQCLRGAAALFSGWPATGFLVSVTEESNRVTGLSVTPLHKRATRPIVFDDSPYDIAANGLEVWHDECRPQPESFPFGRGARWGDCHGYMTLSGLADILFGPGFKFY